MSWCCFDIPRLIIRDAEYLSCGRLVLFSSYFFSVRGLRNIPVAVGLCTLSGVWN